MSSSPHIVVIGPSGAGKSSVVRELHRQAVVHVNPTWTTRPRRPDEMEGSIEHRFVSDVEFEARRAAGGFVGTATMFGLPFRYGLPFPPRSTPGGPIELVMLRAEFVPLFTSRVGDCFVYQIEAPDTLIQVSLEARGISEIERRARLIDNACEVSAGRALAHRRFYNDGALDVLIEAVAHAIRTDADASAAYASAQGF